MAAVASYPYAERLDDELIFLSAPTPGVHQRGKNRMQNWILPGSEHPPAPNRYHMFLNYTCGWSHQALVVRALKGLQDVITVSHTQPSQMGNSDPTGNNFSSLRDIYNSNNPEYGTKQLTVPVLFDKVAKKVVSNDPAHMLLMLNEVFNEWATNASLDLYPVDKREQIEELNAVIWPGVNDGFYRCWFADTDDIWKAAYANLGAALEYIDKRVSEHDFLCGGEVTLADARVFPHLIRFDTIYAHLMLKLRPSMEGVPVWKLSDATVRYVERLHAMPGIRDCGDPHAALHGYYGSKSTDAQKDTMYEERKYEWMPSTAELRQKRASEGLRSPL